MKKKLIVVIAIIAVLGFAGIGLTGCQKSASQKGNEDWGKVGNVWKPPKGYSGNLNVGNGANFVMTNPNKPNSPVKK
jgi:hypothetical protein